MKKIVRIISILLIGLFFINIDIVNADPLDCVGQKSRVHFTMFDDDEEFYEMAGIKYVLQKGSADKDITGMTYNGLKFYYYPVDQKYYALAGTAISYWDRAGKFPSSSYPHLHYMYNGNDSTYHSYGIGADIQFDNSNTKYAIKIVTTGNGSYKKNYTWGDAENALDLYAENAEINPNVEGFEPLGYYYCTSPSTKGEVQQDAYTLMNNITSANPTKGGQTYVPPTPSTDLSIYIGSPKTNSDGTIGYLITMTGYKSYMMQYLNNSGVYTNTTCSTSNSSTRNVTKRDITGIRVIPYTNSTSCSGTYSEVDIVYSEKVYKDKSTISFDNYYYGTVQKDANNNSYCKSINKISTNLDTIYSNEEGCIGFNVNFTNADGKYYKIFNYDNTDTLVTNSKTCNKITSSSITGYLTLSNSHNNRYSTYKIYNNLTDCENNKVEVSTNSKRVKYAYINIIGRDETGKSISSGTTVNNYAYLEKETYNVYNEKSYCWYEASNPSECLSDGPNYNVKVSGTYKLKETLDDGSTIVSKNEFKVIKPPKYDIAISKNNERVESVINRSSLNVSVLANNNDDIDYIEISTDGVNYSKNMLDSNTTYTVKEYYSWESNAYMKNFQIIENGYCQYNFGFIIIESKTTIYAKIHLKSGEVTKIQSTILYNVTNHTLHFDANGGSVNPTSKAVAYKGKYGDLPMPVKTGYTFVGWYNSENNKTKVTSDTILNEENDKTIVAEWKANDYIVYFNAQGGSTNVTSKTVTYKGEYGDLPTATRVGYEFVGWTTADGQYIYSNSTFSTAGNITLFAKWTPNSYNVSFDPNEGSCDTTNIIVKSGENYGLLPEPVREGYNFGGWFTEKVGGTLVTNGTTMTRTVSHTLYAHWVLKSYIVLFDPNGGTVDSMSKTIYYNEEYGTLPVAKREGYTFSGWYTERNGTDAVNEKTKVKNSNHTLYAKWNVNTYEVSFDSNGGSEINKSISVNYDSKYGTLPTTAKNGYNFLGWYTEKTGGKQISETTILTMAKNHVLYAQWAERTHIVKFDLNGGTVAKSIKVVAETKTYGDLPIPTKKGYIFVGWYSSNNELITANSIVTSTEDETLIATWKVNDTKYSVNFNNNGGSGIFETKKVQYNEIYGDLPIPTRIGYTFDGWYTASTSGTKVTSTSKSTYEANHVLYAHWIVNHYTVKLNSNGGSSSTKSVSVTYDSQVGTLPTPQRTNYNFLGWYYGSKKIISTTIFNYPEDIELIAQWQKKTPVAIITGSVESGKKSSSPVTLTADVINGTAREYQWYLDGKIIQGQTFYQYEADTSGDYSVKIVTRDNETISSTKYEVNIKVTLWNKIVNFFKGLFSKNKKSSNQSVNNNSNTTNNNTANNNNNNTSGSTNSNTNIIKTDDSQKLKSIYSDMKKYFTVSSKVNTSKFYMLGNTRDAIKKIYDNNLVNFKDQTIIMPSTYAQLFGRNKYIDSFSSTKGTCDIRNCTLEMLNISDYENNNPWYNPFTGDNKVIYYENPVSSRLKSMNLTLYHRIRYYMMNDDLPVQIFISTGKEVIGLTVVGIDGSTLDSSFDVKNLTSDMFLVADGTGDKFNLTTLNDFCYRFNKEEDLTGTYCKFANKYEFKWDLK